MLTFDRRYDNCFLKWYSESTSRIHCDWELALINICTEFLRGTATTDDCKPIFEQYEKCLSRALNERGIDKMLKEVREDNKENDAEHMKPVSVDLFMSEV
ncbi:hypothetical protein BM1_05441 [Bipolaris maydis]|nr:hypothetical protein BM1_05441 [Bipolaris maydis]